jgi:hypothetical protein
VNRANQIMSSVNDNGNENAISCSVERRGRGTAPPLAQTGGVCVYIESAPHAGMVNKTPHPETRNKALK